MYFIYIINSEIEMNNSARSRHVRGIEDTTRRTGIGEAVIERVVDAFYVRIRADAVLGPVFNARVSDWDDHLATMRRFWSSVTLMSGAYHGEPMTKHAALPLSGADFDRWLALFRQTVEDMCAPEAAAFFIDRSRRIARSLEMGIAVSRGILLKNGERLAPPA